MAGLARHPLWGMSTSKKGEEVRRPDGQLMVISQESRILIAPVVNWDQELGGAISE